MYQWRHVRLKSSGESNVQSVDLELYMKGMSSFPPVRLCPGDVMIIVKSFLLLHRERGKDPYLIKIPAKSFSISSVSSRNR